MGFSSVTGDETIMFSDNVSFDGTQRGGKVTTNGQLLIGSTSSPHIKVGSLTSPDSSVTIGYSSPNITLSAGGAVPTTFTADSGSASPVANILRILGSTTSAGTSPLKTTGGGNTITVVAQISQAIAAADATKIGLSNFDSAKFTVSATGFVSTNGSGIGQTITGDSGGALSPSSGNWNILGLSGSKTSGSSSTLTVKSPPFVQAGSSATSSLNTGEFVTGAFTRTLPASAGLADGDLFIYVCTSASALVIQAVSAQKIRIGSLISSAAGTATSTAIGDSVTLRFNATDGFFYAVSVIGTWLLA